MNSLVTRLTAWYVGLVAVLLLLVTLASSLLLVNRLDGIFRDVFTAKRYEAHRFAQELAAQNTPPQAFAAQFLARIRAEGLNVAVFDRNGDFVAGDPALKDAGTHLAASGELAQRSGSPGSPVVALPVGYAVLAPASGIIWTTLEPYWWLAALSLVLAALLAWLVGRSFAVRALQPLRDVSDALSTLAAGDFSRRTFAMSESSEIGTLAAAYNAAAERVAGEMEERLRTETRMRQFVADAGHELRTPLTVIAGYIDVLRRGAMAEPAVAAQILATMGEEGTRMRALIERLLRLARLDGDAPPQSAAFDLTRMAAGVAVAAQSLAPRAAVRCSAEEALTVNADEDELREALRAIVDNALKYAPGSAVEIAVARNGSFASVSVADAGPGMTADERSHAFERFFRGESRGDVSGAGLGLAIAKRAAERAGGAIELESMPGRGTTVTIRVPFQATNPSLPR
ncbi:HAMP domain-containing histidine kinase [bacterium]|nr:MAG: HAMP domain-containing histidine kinase [bacterium]